MKYLFLILIFCFLTACGSGNKLGASLKSKKREQFFLLFCDRLNQLIPCANKILSNQTVMEGGFELVRNQIENCTQKANSIMSEKEKNLGLGNHLSAKQSRKMLKMTLKPRQELERMEKLDTAKVSTEDLANILNQILEYLKKEKEFISSSIYPSC